LSYWLGIDVGTTFTAAAVCREEMGRRAQPEVIPLGLRSTAVSSVVYLGQDGQVLVGEAAERRAVTNPERVVREFKRRIGDEVPMVIGGVPHSAPEITARVFRWVIDRVAQREGGPATGIVVTHPAGWGTYKIHTMAQALRATDLPEIIFRTEPEAAATSYAFQERIELGSTIAVYDLGGGTFDTAVVRKTGVSTFTVLGRPQGLDHLGGVDFDDAVFRHVLDAVPALRQLDPEDPTVLAATTALRRECIEAKEALSVDTEVTIPVLAPGIQSQVRLVRAEFEEMIRPHVDQTIKALHQALQSAELTARDLDTVLLVGGSSRVPLVAQLVSAGLGRPVAIDTDPKAAIALGAALSAPPTDTTDTLGSDTTGTDLACDATVEREIVAAEPPGFVSESNVPVFTQGDALQRPSLTAIPLDVEPAELQWRRASSRRLKRVALAGALALLTAAGVALVPFLTSRNGLLAPVDAGSPAPSTPLVPGTPAPGTPAPGTAGSAVNAGKSSDESSQRGGFHGVVRTTHSAAPNKPVGGAVNPGPAAEPTSAPQPTWVTSYTWTTSWSNPPSPHSTPPQPSKTTDPTPRPTQPSQTFPSPTTTPTTTIPTATTSPSNRQPT
jgi:actin-like ATPase involved in cell morphogenesis